jgi:phosphohistidine phosphatase
MIMKTLLLIRHAKSSWGDLTLPDFDRPLNERGKHDAPMMAQRLLKKDVHLDLLVSSPARRAKKTAQLFAEVLGLAKESILYREELYLADAEQFYAVIRGIEDTFNTIAIFSHNPGITDFANRLQVASIDEMPTCSIFALTSTVHSWTEFRKAKKEFWFFDFPKNSDAPQSHVEK